MSYKNYITEVPDFPKDGISFKDISPLLADEQTFRSAIVDMGGMYYDEVGVPDYWVGIDVLYLLQLLPHILVVDL